MLRVGSSHSYLFIKEGEMSKQLIEELKKYFEKDISDLGYELVDIEFVTEAGERYLRFYIYNEEGIGIDDCEKVSTFVDPKLDELDLISSSYYLEVSSPDLSRPLKTDADLRRNLGVILDISLYRKIDNLKEYRGELVDFNDETITLMINEDKKEFNRKDVSKVEVAIIF